MTLCALQQTEHVNLASERYGAMLWLYGAAVGVAIISSETYSANIISIRTGALAVTLPDITVQCPTLLACQKKKRKEKKNRFDSSRACLASSGYHLPLWAARGRGGGGGGGGLASSSHTCTVNQPVESRTEQNRLMPPCTFLQEGLFHFIRYHFRCFPPFHSCHSELFNVEPSKNVFFFYMSYGCSSFQELWSNLAIAALSS